MVYARNVAEGQGAGAPFQDQLAVPALVLRPERCLPVLFADRSPLRRDHVKYRFAPRVTLGVTATMPAQQAREQHPPHAPRLTRSTTFPGVPNVAVTTPVPLPLKPTDELATAA